MKPDGKKFVEVNTPVIKMTGKADKRAKYLVRVVNCALGRVFESAGLDGSEVGSEIA
jgi:hypothetical protein